MKPNVLVMKPNVLVLMHPLEIMMIKMMREEQELNNKVS